MSDMDVPRWMLIPLLVWVSVCAVFAVVAHREPRYQTGGYPRTPEVRYCEVNADCHSVLDGVKWFGELKCEVGGYCVGSPLIGEHPRRVEPFTEIEWGHLTNVTVLGVCDTMKNRCER